jgi:hypothetical protein
MFIGQWQLDDYLTFTCNTHDPSTGMVVDADSLPTYRIYEDETGTPVTTGEMTKLDDDNMTGLYSERLQLTSALGFEYGKSYTIVITGITDGVSANLIRSFQVERAFVYTAPLTATSGFIAVADVIAELQVDPDNVATIQLTAISNVIDGVLGLWDELTNRKWAITEYTEYHNYPGDKIYEDPDHDGTYVLFLRHFPVASLLDIWDDPDRAYTTAYRVAATDYVCASEEGIVYFDDEPSKGIRNIKVNYTAGYSATDLVSTFPGIKQLLVRQAAHWYKQGKEAKWDFSSISTPDGGSIAFSQLKDNLLPDFNAASIRYRRWNV